MQGVRQGYAFGAAQPTLRRLHRASLLHRAIQQALHRTTTRSVETNEVIMNCRYGTANFSQNHVYADCECVYGNLSSRVSPCCTPKHCGHNVCCRLHGTTRMSWLNDILHEELLEKPWRWISRPIGYYPYKMLRNRSVKLVFQLSS